MTTRARHLLLSLAVLTGATLGAMLPSFTVSAASTPAQEPLLDAPLPPHVLPPTQLA